MLLWQKALMKKLIYTFCVRPVVTAQAKMTPCNPITFLFDFHPTLCQSQSCVWSTHLQRVGSPSWCSRCLRRHSPVEWSPLRSRTSPSRVYRAVRLGLRMMPNWGCLESVQRLPGPEGSARAPHSSRWGWDLWCKHTHTGRNHTHACKQMTQRQNTEMREVMDTEVRGWEGRALRGRHKRMGGRGGLW